MVDKIEVTQIKENIFICVMIKVILKASKQTMESQFVPQENARRDQDRYPLATETVLKSTFMDDSIDCVETNEESY